MWLDFGIQWKQQGSETSTQYATSSIGLWNWVLLIAFTDQPIKLHIAMRLQPSTHNSTYLLHLQGGKAGKSLLTSLCLPPYPIHNGCVIPATLCHMPTINSYLPSYLSVWWGNLAGKQHPLFSLAKSDHPTSQ